MSWSTFEVEVELDGDFGRVVDEYVGARPLWRLATPDRYFKRRLQPRDYSGWSAQHPHRTVTHRFRTMTKRGTTTQRGYGTTHTNARRRAAQRHQPTDPCARCHKPLGPMGPWLHYDHNPQRSGYLGFSHASCNKRAGAQAGNQRQRRVRFARPRRTSRAW